MSSFERPSAPRLTRDPYSLMRHFMQQPVPALPAAEARDLRDRMIQELERSRGRFIEPRASLGKVQRVLLLAAAACLPVGVLWATRAFHSPPPVHPAAVVQVVPLEGSAEVTRDGVERVVTAAEPASLDSRDDLHTGPEARARASLPTGSVVDIAPSTEVRFDPAGGAEHGPLRDRIELRAGKVQVRVPKLAAGDEVNVLAAGVAVAVHGTEFSVERVVVKSGEPGLTRVAVTEGVVTVYTASEKRVLTARAVFVLVTPPEPTNAPLASPPTTPPPPAVQAASPVPSSAQTMPQSGSSTLAAENALLADGMRLRRVHESQRALVRLRELLEKYPRSPLAESASVERLHALEDLGATTELRREAERYLAEYPGGYARPEASRMLASSTGGKP